MQRTASCIAKLERLAHVLIDQLLQGELAKGAGCPGNGADVGAGSIGRLKRAPERISLFERGNQFQLCNELHRVKATIPDARVN
jgi:hypothetical protein